MKCTIVLLLCSLAVLSISVAGAGASKNSGGKSGGGSSGGKAAQYQAVADSVAKHISDATKKSEELQDEHMKNVDKDPGALITRETMKNMMKGNTFLPQKAGTRTISIQSNQGFNGFTNYQPSGWKVSETMSGPTKRDEEESEPKEPAFTYPVGVGPVLFSQCTEKSYTKTSPCYNSKLFDEELARCKNLMDSAGYIGVGFDGRGFYKAESRKTSLVQRMCANKASFMGQDVPDTMNVFGIFETTAETKSFQSVSQYMKYIRHKAGLSNQKNLFKSEASKYSQASSFGANLGGIGAIGGAAIGAFAGGPAGAMLGASVGGAVGGSIGGGSGSGSGNSNEKSEGTSKSKVEQTDKSSRSQVGSQSFFAMMYVNVILYEITLDELKPSDISLASLKDYMSLPASYYAVGADVKYQNFLLRWGTHFIRSGKFGGQLKIVKTSKANRKMTSSQFASLAETEFKSMFATLQSQYSQKSSSWGFLGFGGKSKSTSQSSKAKNEQNYQSSSNLNQQQSQQASQSEFTQTTVEAQGGTPEIAEALVDFYTPAFKQLYHDWLTSIKDYAKPFEFTLKAINELFNMNMDDLFPAGNKDFGCGKGGKTKNKVLIEPKTNRRYYLDIRTSITNNKTIEEKVRVYCKYSSLDKFKEALERRRISLEKAVAVYMAEGPFPTSSFELKAGETGCEEATISKLAATNQQTEILKFSELKKAPFLLAFDLPSPIPGIATVQSKFRIIYSLRRWFAVEPKASEMHLYDGCRLATDNNKDKICFRNIVLTYSPITGLLHIEPKDFIAAKARNPLLPNWLSGTHVARAQRLLSLKNVAADVHSGTASVPCNVKWLNSHRLDPNRDVNCIHFTAATEGDIFIVFSSTPKDHHTWYYLQISPTGVSFYQSMKLKKSDIDEGMGVLGDKNLYQSFFVCVAQKDGKVLMQYGKADPNSEVGTVHSSYNFKARSKTSRLSFYSFGSGVKSVSLMDIRLTTQLPTVKCLNSNYVKKDGHCVMKCHAECDECITAGDNKACQQCKHVRLESSVAGGKVTECLAECPAGHFKSDKREKLCVPCSAGDYKSGDGNGKCSKCPSGTFSKAGARNCSSCSKGTFNDKEGQAQCRNCAAGSFTATAGATKCTKCGVGKFSGEGKSICSPCPVGHYGDTKGLAQCKPCDAGYFANSTAFTRCTRCPAGSSSAAGSSSCSNSCRKGTFSPRQGVECKNCSAGTYAESAGSTSCTDCAAGTYQPRTGQSSCISAPKGTYISAVRQVAATKCPRGTFNDKEGQNNSNACKACRPGTFSTSGAHKCNLCATGFYQPGSGQHQCLRVSKGHYADTTGLSVQKKCRPGQFAASAGMSRCQDCPSGQVSSIAGATKCTKCPAGQKVKQLGIQCSKCPAGMFSTSEGSTACTKCPAGTISTTEGSKACTKCPAGTISTTEGSTACTKCPAGTISTSEGSTACTKCAAGMFSTSEGSTACTKCPAGTISTSEGSTACTKCPTGTISTSEGSTACTKCPAGTISTSEGSTACTKCAAGSISTSEGSTACTKCPVGQYSATSTKCELCALPYDRAQKGCHHGKLQLINCKQSSAPYGGVCSRAIDGNTNQHWLGGSCTHTHIQPNQWWQASLKTVSRVSSVKIFNRQDCCANRLNNFEIQVDGRVCATYNSGASFSIKEFPCDATGQVIKVQSRLNDALTICEIEVYGYQ